MQIRQVKLAAEEALLNEPLYRDLRPTIVDFVRRLQTAVTPEDWTLLHRNLVIEFGGRQDAIDTAISSARATVRQRIAGLAAVTPKPVTEIQEQQAILERVERQELVARASQHLLREIGDGIAWRALSYDRRAITILGRGERVGRLASGVGRDAELVELWRLWHEEGVFAIHNDLTNCLRHGDLTAIRPRDDGRIDVDLIEVKASERLGDDTPQMGRLARATDLLRENRFIDDEGALLELTVIPDTYETHIGTLAQLIVAARANAFDWAMPYPSLLVGAVDYSVWPRVENANRRCTERRREVGGWDAGEPDTLNWTFSLRRMRDRGWSTSSIAPISIFPLPPEDVADLLMGFLDISVSIHLAGLEAALSRNGLSVQVARPPLSEKRFLEASRGDAGVILPPHVREQMMDELMTVDTLFAMVDQVVSLNQADPAGRSSQRVVTFEDEIADVGGARGSSGRGTRRHGRRRVASTRPVSSA